MPSKRVVVLAPFWCFVLILVAWNKSSIGEPFTRFSALCLRECQQARRDILQTDLQTINDAVLSSCHRKCLLGQKDKVHLSQEKGVRNRHKRSLIKRAAGYATCPPASPSLEWRPSEINVTFAQYPYSDDWFINVTWTPMNDSGNYWHNIVVELNADYEKMTPDCYKLPKNSKFFVENISAYNYSYDDPIYLLVHSLPHNTTITSLTQFSPPKELHTPLGPPSTTEYTPPTTPEDSLGGGKTVAISFGVIAGLALSLCFIIILVRCCRSPKQMIVFPEEFKYGAFIVFSSLDMRIMQKVLHFLETELHLKCCVHFRDFAPGIPFVENMAYSVNNSYKVVVLFSNNFLTSPFAEFEMKLAIHRMVEKRDNSLVVMKIDDVDRTRLPPELITRSFIDYSSILEWPFWKQRLIDFLNDNNNNNNVCNELTDRPRYARLPSTSSLSSQVSNV
ncbi:uncharacterized protein LOC114956902 [Acropora millepora]|uniref:uncharacterized protein LOC114956902 n=1 Tax=Acropora millepora TaxID=45264 RepID=UPI001CF25E25|nr:uncharacterized protein LOC114956902 [Acropora millepora]